MSELETETEYEAEQPEIIRMTDSELASVISQELSRGIGGSVASDSNTEISLALDYYHGRLPGLSAIRAKDKNASKYVSQDVMDSVEATIAEIMPAFTADQVGVFQPDSEEDESRAAQETDICNYLLMEEYDGHEIIQTALRDALINRNCSAKVFWDEKIEVEYETFEDVPELALVNILQPQDENETIEVVEQYVSEESNEEAEAYIVSQQHALDMQNMQVAIQDPEIAGNPDAQQEMAQQGQMMQEAMLAAQDKYSLKIKRIKTTGRPVIMSLPPENVIVAGEHTTPTLNDCRFAAHEMVETKSNLIAAGFDKAVIERLPQYNSNLENNSRSREADEGDWNSAHSSTKLVQVFDCYIDIDGDGDGIAERLHVIQGGNGDILLREEVTDTTLVGGCTQAMPHKYKGISMFDRIKDIQDSKTPIMRAIIDGVQLSSNPRIGVVTGMGANIEDLLTSRTGGVARTENANAYFAMPNPEVPQSSYQFLEQMDNIRRDRGGGAVDTASQAQAVSNDSAHGLERVMSAMELSNAHLARTFGETFVRGLFIQMHNVLRENRKTPIAAKIGGRWVETVPTQWKKRTGVQIHVGTSHGERARQANMMNNIVMTQMQLKESGSVMYDEAKHYAALVETARLSGVKNPEQYYLDVQSPEAQQKQQVQSQQQQEAQQMQEQAQQMVVEAQAKIGEAEMLTAKAGLQQNRMDFEMDKLKAQIESLQSANEMAFKREELADKTALKLTEIEVQAGKDLNAEVEDNMIITEA